MKKPRQIAAFTLEWHAGPDEEFSPEFQAEVINFLETRRDDIMASLSPGMKLHLLAGNTVEAVIKELAIPFTIRIWRVLVTPTTDRIQ